MKIEINITGTENLSDAINNLAMAICKGNPANVIAFATNANVKPSLPDADNTEKEAPGNDGEPKLSAADQKQLIADKIKALGFEPPEKGTVAKFQEALEAAQSAPVKEIAETTATPPPSATGAQKTGEDEEDEPEENTEDDEPEEITEDSTRKLAVFMIENHPNTDLAKSTLGAILKKANVKAITGANKIALAIIHPLLQAQVDKLKTVEEETEIESDGL